MRSRAVCLGALLLAVGCATAPRVPEPAPGAAGAKANLPLGEGVRPGGPEASLAEAREALAARNYRRAAEAAAAAGAASPHRLEAREVEATARRAMGDPSGALPLLEEVARSPRSGTSSLAAYAGLAVRLGEGRAALALIEERLAAAPEDPELNGLAGWVALAVGDTSRARTRLEAAWSAAGRERFAVPLGRARLLTGDPGGAAEAAELATRARGDAEAWELLGDARQAQGLAAAAESAYRKALELAPEGYAARVNLGVLRLAQGNPAGAEALFLAATGERPDAPEAWTDLGLARRARGDLEGARDAYERALSVAPGYPKALKALAILHEKYLAEPAAALPLYDRYLEARPADEEVARWRKAAERRAREGGS